MDNVPILAGSVFGVQESVSSVGVLWLWGGSSAAVGFDSWCWLLASSLLRLTLKHFTLCCLLCNVIIFSASGRTAENYVSSGPQSAQLSTSWRTMVRRRTKNCTARTWSIILAWKYFYDDDTANNNLPRLAKRELCQRVSRNFATQRSVCTHPLTHVSVVTLFFFLKKLGV